MILDHSDLKYISEKGRTLIFFAILRRKFMLTWNTLIEHFMYSLGESLKSFKNFITHLEIDFSCLILRLSLIHSVKARNKRRYSKTDVKLI